MTSTNNTLTLSPTTLSSLSNHSLNNSYATINVDNAQYPLQDSSKTSVYQDMYRVLQNGGEVHLQKDMSDEESMGFLLAGFVVKNQKLVQKQASGVQVGMKMSLKGKNVVQNGVPQKFTLDTTDDFDMDDEELIDEDDLLEDEDLAKPVVPQASECSTGTRKACKNCSCGRAEQEEEEEKLTRQAKMELIKKGVVTGCGSCGLGDAFRCESCPFLGMPKFVPGQENGSVMLDLTDDI
eukprot:CAMPEP_0117443930 /NCGR_PEP_ID=MMETSP0759-20121206/4965_1 /TAXON_ID=63605 /ORGANISM="Percolomonas cosmopolitus, Strain WS" /LENGTH=236 /DNA_ID=CAMNT_0005235953 /DNA_START=8 /DNA_END=718 /DNA_ORIENTATION=+